MKKYILLFVLSCFYSAFNIGAQNMEACRSTLHVGEGIFTYKEYAPFANRPIDVHYYIPPFGNIANMPIIFVFEGGDRGYSYLLETWKKEAEKHNFIVFIPHFDLARYPLCDYQEVGVMDKEHLFVRPLEQQTPVLIDKIFEYICQQLDSKRKGYVVYGHSAGGQFVQRFMLFHDSPYVEKAVIGSPGWYTFPDSSKKFPYGISNVPFVTPNDIKKYLAKPIVLQLATGDTIRESYLRKTHEAEEQGANRYVRGNNFYRYIQKLATEYNWSCNWKKIEEQGIGHNSSDMGKCAVPLIFEDSILHIQSEIITSLFYPDPDNKYCTPTLGKPIEEGLASVLEINSYLKSLTEKHPKKVYMSSMGTTPGGQDIPILYFGATGGSEKIKVWIQAALHGNEPAGVESICLLSDYLLNTVDGAILLDKIDIALIPVANVDGYSLQNRLSGSGFDLNRDQTKLADPVTILLKQAYTSWNPDIALDIHEFRPIRKEFSLLNGNKLSIAADVLFLPSGHLNIPEDLRYLCNDVFQHETEKALNMRGYSTGFYFSPAIKGDSLYAIKGAKSPQSSSTFQGLTNTISLFIEIRGIGLGRTSFARRAESGFLVAKSILENATLHTKIIKASLQKVIEETCLGKQDIYVTFKPTYMEYPISFIDVIDGEKFTASLPTLDALILRPDIVRKRPYAYILGNNCLEAVKKLRILGIEVEYIKKPFTVMVEKYVISEYETAIREWEKIYLVNVTTKLIEEEKNFMTGGFLVHLDQKNANLAVTLLEPESANGFVNFGVISTASGEELSVYRLMENSRLMEN